MSTMKGDTPQTGAGDLASFFPRPMMHTYFALPPSRAEDELPCADRQSSSGPWTGQLLHWAVKSSCRAVTGMSHPRHGTERPRGRCNLLALELSCLNQVRDDLLQLLVQLLQHWALPCKQHIEHDTKCKLAAALQVDLLP